jgi:catechol 2,3-dioxygenase-like lactoylglutathione lyase family enzyme
MSIVNAINHVAILTSDLARFITFYSDVFGLELIFEEETPAFRHAILRIGERCWLHPAEVFGNAHGPAIPEMFARGHLDHIALSADSSEAFETIRARLIARGASTGQVEDLGAFRALWFTDPDGMRGELTRIVDPELREFHAPRPVEARASEPS